MTHIFFQLLFFSFSLVTNEIFFLTLLAIVPICVGELVSISEYIGHHKFACSYSSITGSIIGDKIYTFGGCYPLFFMYDSIITKFRFTGLVTIPNEKYNSTGSIQMYDITLDKWSTEPEIRTPFPWKKALTQTYKQTIYFHNIMTKEFQSTSAEMWKYDTSLKKWSQLPDLPFKWFGTLMSCQINGKIYFTGSNEGRQNNNIVQVYDADNQE